MMKAVRMCSAVLAGVVFAGCSQAGTEDEKAQTPQQTAVKAAENAAPATITVNGATLTKAQVEADVEAVIKASGDRIPVERLDEARRGFATQLVQEFVFETALVAKAKADGYVVTADDRQRTEAEMLKMLSRMPDAPKTFDDYCKKSPFGEARARAKFENSVLIDKMVKDVLAKKLTKDYTAEAKKVIDGLVAENAKRAKTDEEALAKIKALKAELDKTPADKVAEKFAELAKANSSCPSGAQGGDLREFGHGQMVPEFDKVAFELPEGKVSDPVKTQFGQHLILVTKKIPAVPAKGDTPEVPEKVRASHILISLQQPLPTTEEVVASLKRPDEQPIVRDFVQEVLKAAKLEATGEYQMFLPPKEEPAPSVENAEKK